MKKTLTYIAERGMARFTLALFALLLLVHSGAAAVVLIYARIMIDKLLTLMP